MIYWRFFWSLLRHKWFVFRAGLWLGVPLWRLLVHDLSKFSRAEFGRYARNFQGDYSSSPNDRERVKDEFALAWLHHENHNDHHWGHWIPRSGKKQYWPLTMQEVCAREMVADCHGAGRAYTGSWDIAVWMNEHGQFWDIDKQTRALIGDAMIDLGYFLTDNCEWSWMLGEGVVMKAKRREAE